MKKTAFVNLLPVRFLQLEAMLHAQLSLAELPSAISLVEYLKKGGSLGLVIFATDMQDKPAMWVIGQTMPYLIEMGVPVVLLASKFSFNQKKQAVKLGVASIFELDDIKRPDFIPSLQKIIDNPPIRVARDGKVRQVPKTKYRYKTPLGKRLFDIVVSGTILLLLSPLYALIAALIRLESKGPVFYVSKRVGAGYHVFDFYKFRTMVPDADKKLKLLSHLNQYADAVVPGGGAEAIAAAGFERCEVCAPLGLPCENILYDDSGQPICEKVFLKKKKEAKDTFFKISNDPRITRLGKFLRNSSLDELPQLFNVFKGDMSIVGNRPLPLYEAEKLTNDVFAKRFLAPAGLTGLWQVTKRGKSGPMSEGERIGLDNLYAGRYSMLFDIKIILKTIPALFQKDNV